MNPKGSVTARYGHTAIYDPATKRMVVFGGFDGFTPMNDVRALSLAGTPSWSKQAAWPPPPRRYGHQAVHDSAAGRMVMWGGRDDSGSRQDEWALSLAGRPAWSALAGGSPPSELSKLLPTMWSLETGMGRAVGDYNGRAEAGLRLGASAEYMIARGATFGVDVSYNNNPVSGDEFTTLQYGIHTRMIYSRANKPTSLWVLLGLGGYSNEEKYFANQFSKSTTVSYTRPGAKFGAGVDFKALKKVSLGVGADFNLIMYDNDPLEWIKYDGLHARITFH